MIHRPSEYQRKIYDFVKDGSGNGIVEAVAGSGKTTTIVRAIDLIPKKKVVFLAFNKSIQEELRRKLPKTVRVSTLHQLGNSMFYQNNIRPVLDENKLRGIIERRLRNYEEPENSLLTNFLLQVVPKVKLSMCDVTQESIEALPNVYEEVTPFKLQLVEEMLEESINMPHIIDYADMVWIPVKMQFNYTKYNWVFVDEVQDLSRTQFELIKIICDEHTRIIAVGDSMQSMYGFRCADINSMKNFKEYFNAKDFPLSICYRCPKKVVKMAQRIVPQIEAWEKAEEGLIADISFKNMIEKVEQGDMILCRTNAPLVNVVFHLIRAGKKATIKGKDMQKHLLNTIKYNNPKDLHNLREKVVKRLVQYQDRLDTLSDIPVTSQVYHDKKKLERMMDLYNTLLFFMENVSTMLELKEKIESVFSESINYITCSTIHKVKGLEADRVFIYRYDLMPHPMASSDRELQEERNIEYVAITRTKKELYLISE